jgi:hypothetical protein
MTRQRRRGGAGLKTQIDMWPRLTTVLLVRPRKSNFEKELDVVSKLNCQPQVPKIHVYMNFPTVDQGLGGNSKHPPQITAVAVWNRKVF